MRWFKSCSKVNVPSSHMACKRTKSKKFGDRNKDIFHNDYRSVIRWQFDRDGVVGISRLMLKKRGQLNFSWGNWSIPLVQDLAALQGKVGVLYPEGNQLTKDILQRNNHWSHSIVKILLSIPCVMLIIPTANRDIKKIESEWCCWRLNNNSRC